MKIIKCKDKSTEPGNRKPWKKSSKTFYLLYNLPIHSVDDFFSLPGSSSDNKGFN